MRRISAVFLCALCMMRTPHAVGVTADTKSKIKDLAQDATTAGAIGVTAWGGRDMLSGMAEKSADTDAEQDMRAYLATFRCDYGRGRNIVGGDTGITLPGDNELAPLYQEYVALAQNVKASKQAMGLRAGIESELVIDSASAGLYDDVASERAPGAFTSLSRALLDANGRDAKDWAAKKSKTGDKIKSGAYKAAAGVALGVASNVISNISIKSGNGTASGNNSGPNGNGGRGGILGGLFGDAVPDNASTSAYNASTSGTVTAAPGTADEQFQRAENARHALQSEISPQAASFFSQLQAVKTEAENAELDTIAIDTALSDAETAKNNIQRAISAAASAFDKAKEETAPECAATEPTAPVKDDYSETCDEEDGDCETYESAMKTYNTDKRQYDADKKKCDQDDKDYIAKLKRHADEAARQERIGRDELTKIQTALSTAQSAKATAAANKKKTEEKEAAEEKATAERKAKIAEQANLATKAADEAREYYAKARSLQVFATAAAILGDGEDEAETQVTSLMNNINEDLKAAKTASEAAAAQIEIATDARNIDAATAAVSAAQRQADIAKKSVETMEKTLQQIKDAKAAAKAEYEKQQAAEPATEDSADGDDEQDPEE